MGNDGHPGASAAGAGALKVGEGGPGDATGPRGWTQSLNGAIERISRYCLIIAGCCLMAIVVATTLNIIFRRTSFLPPILGVHEASAYLGSLVIALSLSFTQLRRGHIAVDILQPLLSKRTEAIAMRVNGLIGAVFCALVAWRSVVYALGLRADEEVSMTMGIPFYPFVLVIGASFALLGVVLILDVFRPADQVSS